MSRFCVLRSIAASHFKLRHKLVRPSKPRTLMKLNVEDATDRVLSAHMVGPDAGEIVQDFSVAMKGSANKTIVDSTIGVHTTVTEESATVREPVKASAGLPVAKTST